MLSAKTNNNYLSLNRKTNLKFNFESFNDEPVKKNANKNHKKTRLKKRSKSSLSAVNKINDNIYRLENQNDEQNNGSLYKNILTNRKKVFINSALSSKMNINLKEDIKTRVYKSFLEDTYINPFKSNYDILAKSNPNFYLNLMRENEIHRFNRAKSSLNIIDYSLNNSIFKKLIIAQTLFKSQKKNDQNEKGPESENYKQENDMKNLFIDFRSQKNNNQISDAFSNKNSNINSEKKKTNSSSQNNDGRASLNNSKYEKCYVNKLCINDLKEKEILMYIDERKLVYIKNWLENVERAHEKDGKFLETINKITFYDD